MDNQIRTIRWITFIALLTVAAAFLFFQVEWTPIKILGGVSLVLAAAAMLTWALEVWLKYLLKELRGGRSDNESVRSSVLSPDAKRLLSASHKIFIAATRSEIVEIAMQAGVSLLDANGASFVSFEEWGAPLRPSNVGTVPSSERFSWHARLIDPATRQVCRICTLREAGSDCFLCKDVIINPSKIMCQPLFEQSREIGVINFFFNSQDNITPDRRELVSILVEQASTALMSIRRRELEIESFAYHQITNSDKIIADHLAALCLDLEKAMDAESAVVWMPGELSADQPSHLFSSKETLSGRGFVPNDNLIRELWTKMESSPGVFERQLGNSGIDGAALFSLVLPIQSTDKKTDSLMIIINNKSFNLNRQQSALLQTIAGNISILIQSTRMLEQLEFKAALDERIRLAREIHDGLAQTIAFLKIQSAQMLTYLRMGTIDKLEVALSANYQTLTEAYQDARLAIENLRATPESDTQDWLRKIARDFSNATGLPVNMSKLEMKVDYPLPIQAQLIRVVQEAFSNIRKHAHATQVNLSGSVKSDETVIEISDDGLGFDPDQIDDGSRYGLVGMRERTDMIGGDFQIISRQAEGTTVRISIPYKNKVS
jgi:two-component system, NarL family, nitrate/nitrite sensor histidine kinase NarX